MLEKRLFLSKERHLQLIEEYYIKPPVSWPLLHTHETINFLSLDHVTLAKSGKKRFNSPGHFAGYLQMFPKPLHDFLFMKRIIKSLHAFKEPQETIAILLQTLRCTRI